MFTAHTVWCQSVDISASHLDCDLRRGISNLVLFVSARGMIELYQHMLNEVKVAKIFLKNRTLTMNHNICQK